VAIAATPAAGKVFAGWTATANAAVAQPAAATTTVTLAGDATVTANFADEEPPPPVTAQLTMTAVPPDDGTTTPSVDGSPHTVEVGVPVAIAATPAAGKVFAGWTATANAAVAQPAAATTTVTLAGDATVTANFADTPLEQIAVGSHFEVSIDEVGLPDQFITRPRLTAIYTDPVSRIHGRKAGAKVVTKVGAKLPTDVIVGEWTKKIRLYDARLLRAHNKVGDNSAAWLAANPVQNQHVELALTLTSKQVANGIPQALRTLHLTPPVITSTRNGNPDLKGNPTIEITGAWFGTRKPKAWFEYTVEGNAARKLKAKVLAPDATYTNGKGKGIFMDQRTGASRLVVLRPTTLPTEVDNWEAITHIVVDNGCGLAAQAIDWDELP
jgi:uncharacterized repeat protein (TIGR02543 family)